MERGEWILKDVKYAIDVLDEIDQIAQDVYVIVID